MGQFSRIMDTLSLMQQLLPHLQAATSTQQQQQQQNLHIPSAATSASSASSATTSAASTITTTNFSSPSSNYSSNNHTVGMLPFGFIKISPTTTVIDASCGFPTAAEAASPPSSHNNNNSFMSLISKTEAALPPEAASTSGASTAATSCFLPPPPPPPPTVPQCLVQSYMAAVHAAAALQSDAFHSAFRTPFPSSSSSTSQQSSPSSMPPPTSTSSTPFPSSTTTTTTSDSFLILALNTLVSSSDASNDSKDDGKSSYDGTNRGALLCVVCSDTASGFHYGVFACEGCKGFFRRSIHQNISYRACSKSQQCAIVRNNRNRCQYCRLKKCLSVGMSRDAVRFGRVPKREKVRMVEEMQRATIRSLMDSMTVELEDEQTILTTIEWGFQEFGDSLRKEMNIGNLHNSCTFNTNNNNNQNVINDQMQQLLKTFSAAINGGNGSSFDGFMQAAATAVAASNGTNNNNNNNNMSGCPITKTDSYLSLLKSVVQFSESIRGFQFLYKEDKVKLLKNSIFPVLLLRLASIKISDSEFLFSIHQNYNNRFGNNNNCNSNILQETFHSTQNSNNSGKINSEIINDFIHRLRSINLDEKQMALFTALVITQADSAGAGGCNMAAAGGFESSQTNLIKILQEKFWFVLQKTFFSSNAIDLTIKIQSLFSLLTDLKQINEMHESRLKIFSFIGHLPSPQITTTVSASPSATATTTNTTLMPLAAATKASNNIKNFMPSIIAPKMEPIDLSPMNGIIGEAMPTLRKALETSLKTEDSSTPTTTSLPMAQNGNGNVRSVCDRHPAVASLLSRPPLSTPSSKLSKMNNSSVIVKSECIDGISNSTDIDMKDDSIILTDKMIIKSELSENENNNDIVVDDDDDDDEEDDEMPLNLCIRDNKISSS